MARHFLGLYLLIFATLAGVSYVQDKLWQLYSPAATAEDRPLILAAAAVNLELQRHPVDQWKQTVAEFAKTSGADIDLLGLSDIAGNDILAMLKNRGVAHLRAAGQIWFLKQIDKDHVLAIKTADPDTERTALDWALTILFYSTIALVIMIWLWPLSRDLSKLERSASQFGNRNWAFNLNIKANSQIYPLSQTFRKMATRIDGLISSHKDMSNALSHEIRTPLSRMQFEIELAQETENPTNIRIILQHIKRDIAAINNLATATLNYAILERADTAIQTKAHDFTALIPAIAEYVRRDTRPDLSLKTDIQSDANKIICDAHLLESAIKNLLYNAARYAQREIQISFTAENGNNNLTIDDDGPGIPAEDRFRVFESFVRLDLNAEKKTGFGLGLAIVKRIFELHHGSISVSESPLGGARFSATWPSREASD